MPVIGRLDKQVNDILITPLDNRTATPNEHQPDGDATPSEITLPHNVDVDEAAKAEKMSGAQEPLPVWLL